MVTRLKTRKDHAKAIMKTLDFTFEAIEYDRAKVQRVEKILEHYLDVTLKDSGIKGELRDIKNQLKHRQQSGRMRR